MGNTYYLWPGETPGWLRIAIYDGDDYLSDSATNSAREIANLFCHIENIGAEFKWEKPEGLK